MSIMYIVLHYLWKVLLCMKSENYYLWIIAGSLESAYSLNWGAREIWGQDLGTFMISRPI